MATTESSTASAASNFVEKIEPGNLAWVPASATQLMFTPPPELNVNSSGGRMAFLPTTLRVVDDGGVGQFALEWSSNVIIKCRMDEAFLRIPPSQDFENEINIQQLSKLDIINQATVTDHLWSRYRRGYLSGVCGSSSFFINPLQLRSPATSGMTGTPQQEYIKHSSSNISSTASFPHVHTISSDDFDGPSSSPDAPNSSRAGGPSAPQVLGSVIRTLKESAYPQTLVPRGSIGSGKSEMCKEALQMVIFADSVRKDYFSDTSTTASRSNQSQRGRPNATPPFEPRGWVNNPFWVCSDTTSLGASIRAGVCVMDALTSTVIPDRGIMFSTRCVRVCRVNYFMGDSLVPGVSQLSQNMSQEQQLPVGSVAGVEYFTIFTESPAVRTGYKDSSANNPNRPLVIYALLAAALCESTQTQSLLSCVESVSAPLRLSNTPSGDTSASTGGLGGQKLTTQSLIESIATVHTIANFHITSSMRDTVMSVAAGLPDSSVECLVQQFVCLHMHVLNAGVSVELWSSCVCALVACMHLQMLTIVGADQAIVSAGTKNCVPYAEELLAVETGVIMDLVLHKTEDKMGRSVVTDNKLVDAKIVVDALVGEIYRRVVECLTATLSEQSFENILQEKTGGFGLPPTFQGFVPLNIVDFPGWEMLDGGACSGFSQMTCNYMEERLCVHFTELHFNRELRKLEEEGIHLADIIVPDNSSIMDLFEKPVSGLMSLLDETCVFVRGDDKTFADKTIATHVKTKLVRSGGAKAKQATAFVVRHSFGEVTYDCAGFVQVSRTRLPPNAVAVLNSAPLPCLNPSTFTQTSPNRLGSTDIITTALTSRLQTNSGTQSATPGGATDEPPATPTAAAGAGSGAPATIGKLSAKGFGSNSSSSSQGSGFGSKQPFPFTKCKDTLAKLLKSIEDTSSTTHVLCVRPHADGNSRAFNPEYVARQVKQLSLPEIARFRKNGFSFNCTYADLYARFRVCVHLFNPKFPPVLTHTHTANKAEVEKLSKALLGHCLEELALRGSVGQQRASSNNTHANIQAAAPPRGSLPQQQQMLTHANTNSYTQAALANNELVFGSVRVFMREALIDSLELLRAHKQRTLTQAATTLQACVRMFVRRTQYTRVCIGVLLLQSAARMHTHRMLFTHQKFVANKIKATWRMHVQCTQYTKLQWAVGVLKTRLFQGLLQRIRFVHMQRCVRVFQSLARSFPLRALSDKVLWAVNVLHTQARLFLIRLRRRQLRDKACAAIQRVWRGCLFRFTNAAIAYALKVRRNQRIVRVVVKKLQSKWRGIMVRKRFRQVHFATVVLQRWCRARLTRFTFRRIQSLAVWLQKHTRKILAVSRMHQMKLTALMKEEREQVRQARAKELSLLQPDSNPPSDAAPTTDRSGPMNPVDLKIASGTYSTTGHAEMFNRRVIGINVTATTHAHAYPYTWMSTAVEFSHYLKHTTHKRFVTDIQLGHTHSLWVDNNSCVYTSGLSDCGQTGHNNKVDVLTKAPKRVEAWETVIAAQERMYVRAQSKGPESRLKDISVSVSQICCGKDFTLLLVNSGRVYSWGSNKRGQLGHSSDRNNVALPTLVGGAHNKNITSITCGAAHAVMLSATLSPSGGRGGKLYVWGAGYALGRLQGEARRGDGSSPRKKFNNSPLPRGNSEDDQDNENAEWMNQDCWEPCDLPFFSKRKVQAIYSGDFHIIVKSAGELLAWGLNSSGQLGDGTHTHRQLPTSVCGLSSQDSSILLPADIRSQLESQISRERIAQHKRELKQLEQFPKKTHSRRPPTLTHAHAHAYTHALTPDTHASHTSVDPSQVELLPLTEAQMANQVNTRVQILLEAAVEGLGVVCVGKHNGIVHEGKIYMWGSNRYGQLGLGRSTDVDILEPTLVEIPDAPEGIKQISTGHHCTIAQTLDTNRVFAWGTTCFITAKPNDKYTHTNTARANILAGGVAVGGTVPPPAQSTTPVLYSTPTMVELHPDAYGYTHSVSVLSSPAFSCMCVDSIQHFGVQPESTNASKYSSSRHVEPLAPQHILELTKHTDTFSSAVTHEEIKQKFREHHVNINNPNTPQKFQFQSQLSQKQSPTQSQAQAQAQTPTSSKQQQSQQNFNQRQMSPQTLAVQRLRYDVDTDKLLDIFSPLKDRKALTSSNSSSVAGIAAASSTTTTRTEYSRSVTAATKTPVKDTAVSSDLLTKFASTVNSRGTKGSKKSGAGGSFSIVPREDKVVIPLLGIGVDTAMRGDLVVHDVNAGNTGTGSSPGAASAQQQQSQQQQQRSTPVSAAKLQRKGSRIATAGTGFTSSSAPTVEIPASLSATLTPFTQSTTGSPLKRPTSQQSPLARTASRQALIISPLHQAVTSGIIDPATGLTIMQDRQDNKVVSGRRASMPAGPKSGGTAGGANNNVMDVKKILSGLGNRRGSAAAVVSASSSTHNALLSHLNEQTESHAAAAAAAEAEDEDINLQVAALQQEMVARTQQSRLVSTVRSKQQQQQPQGFHRRPSGDSFMGSAAGGGGGPGVPTLAGGGKKKTRNLSGASDNSETSSSQAGAAAGGGGAIDMATVRDLTTMISSIKKETISSMASAWKR